MINVPSTQVSVTPAVHRLMLQGINFGPFVARHLRGDWGDINEAERTRNIQSLEQGNGHVLSVHHVTPEITVWITTKAGKTVIMLPLA
ncbi:hypothetical protein UK30_10070 [Salmonella enterica]|uniref:hypothetical protein n=1 Tax=Salmonella enterica TaxID=28901 RepID=UPI0011181A7E|nr:hypothetical protein [Salmonella enterica]EBP4342189.1 hypothetical protein [Salmonella enterica]